jgi:hypothetical protein
LVVVLTVVVLGCTSTRNISVSGDRPGAEATCFNVIDLRSLTALHDRYVFARCRRGKHYLLTMAPACQGLQNSIAMVVSNDFNRVCSHDQARLTYRDFDRTRDCVILRVEAVENRAAALDLVAHRTQPEAK